MLKIGETAKTSNHVIYVSVENNFVHINGGHCCILLGVHRCVKLFFAHAADGANASVSASGKGAI